MIAVDLKNELVGCGATVIGPAPSLGKAIELIESNPVIDAAILDVNLKGEKVFLAADLLTLRGIPFLLATGYDKSAIPARYDGVIRCEKPIGSDKMTQVVADKLLGRSSES